MAKGTTKKPYKMRFTVEELREKTYRKYRYPQEVDGITFTDDTEKKLSESTWFRCLKPEQQVIIEKQMRLRANGQYNKRILHYEDTLNEAALGISKPTMTRLIESLAPKELQVFFAITPYIHINDGLLRNKDRQLMTIDWLSEATKIPPTTILKTFEILDTKRLIFMVEAEKLEAPDKNDVYLSFAERIDNNLRIELARRKPYIIYVNPYIVFFGQYIDTYVMPFFTNSGWYVINPYADRIADWINHNCRFFEWQKIQM